MPERSHEISVKLTVVDVSNRKCGAPEVAILGVFLRMLRSICIVRCELFSYDVYYDSLSLEELKYNHTSADVSTSGSALMC